MVPHHSCHPVGHSQIHHCALSARHQRLRRAGAALQTARLWRTRRIQPGIGRAGRHGASGQFHGYRHRQRPAGGQTLLRLRDGGLFHSCGRAQHHHQLGTRARGRCLPQHAAPVCPAGQRGSRSERQLRYLSRLRCHLGAAVARCGDRLGRNRGDTPRLGRSGHYRAASGANTGAAFWLHHQQQGLQGAAIRAHHSGRQHQPHVFAADSAQSARSGFFGRERGLWHGRRLAAATQPRHDEICHEMLGSAHQWPMARCVQRPGGRPQQGLQARTHHAGATARWKHPNPAGRRLASPRARAAAHRV